VDADNLARRAGAGDRAALEVLLMAQANAAYVLASAITTDPADAEDACQEAFLRATRDIGRYEPTSPFRAWFLALVRNAAVSLVRSRGARRRRERSVAVRPVSRSPDPGEKLDLSSALQGALMTLEERHRLAVLLCCQQGLSHAEAARVLSQPKGTISANVSRGLERLRGSLARNGYMAAGGALAAMLARAPRAVAPAALRDSVRAIISNAAPVGKAAAVTAAVRGGIGMKLVAGVVLTGAVAAGVAVVSPGTGGGPAPLPAETVPENLPKVVLDESASRWVIDRFAGNSTAGPDFLQGPARQTGGLGSCTVDPAPDGSVFLGAGMSNKWAKDKIVRVSPEGTLRLVAGGGSNLGDGPASQAMVRVESLRYSAAEKSLYFVHRTIPCVRRLYEKDGQWLVEVVAGDPAKTGSTDGQGRAALFTQPRSLAITSTGTVYMLDGTKLLRKIEKGRVSTVAKFGGGPKLIDGPLGQASMAITKMSGQICLGENDHTLYVADHWNFAVRKIDLAARTVSTPAWSATSSRRKSKIKRPKGGTDGPALTHANFVSGIAFVCWDPVHEALWCGGPDESRLRWFKDGWIRTPLPFKRSNKWRINGTGLKPEETSLVWVHVKAVDKKGRAYISASSSKTGVWRAYEKGGAQ